MTNAFKKPLLDNYRPGFIALILVLFSVTAVGQQSYPQLLPAPERRHYFQADSASYVPWGTNPSLRGGMNIPGGLFYRTTDSSLYAWTGTQWIVAVRGSGGTGGLAGGNLGSGWRVYSPVSSGVRTLFPGYGALIDSTTNANGLTFKVDTATLFPQIRSTVPVPTLQQILTSGNLITDPTAEIENDASNLTGSLSLSQGVGGSYKSTWGLAYNGNNILTSDPASSYISGFVNTGPSATFFGTTQRPWQSYLYNRLNGVKYVFMGLDSNWARISADSLKITAPTKIFSKLIIGEPTGTSTVATATSYVFQAALSTGASRLNQFVVYIGPDSNNAPLNVVDVGIGTKNATAGLAVFLEDGAYQQTWRPNGGTTVGKGWATNAGHRTPPINGLAVQGMTIFGDTLQYEAIAVSSSSSDSVLVSGAGGKIFKGPPLSSLGGGGGGSETLEDVLNNGSTMTTGHTVNLGSNAFNWQNTTGTIFRITSGGVDFGDISGGETILSVNYGSSAIQFQASDGATSTGVNMDQDSINLLGIDYSVDTTGRKVLTINPVTGALAYNNWRGAGGGSTLLSALTAATGTNTINNAANLQEWQWNSLVGKGFLISSNSTAAASNTQSLFNVELSGANGTSAQTTSAVTFSNTHTGTTSKNIGATISASGGTNNFGARISPALLIGSPAENATDALIIQSLTNTATDGMRIYANNNSSFTQYGWAAITRAGAFTIGTTSGALNLTPSTGVYIGSTSTTTSWLQIAAGTTSKAPFKLVSGTNLTTPEAGAMEYNGIWWVSDAAGRMPMGYRQFGVTAIDANYNVVASNGPQLVSLPIITANRTVTLPAASQMPGQFITVWNKNTAGFTWTFATNLPVDATGTGISTTTNQSLHVLVSDGTNWIKTN